MCVYIYIYIHTYIRLVFRPRSISKTRWVPATVLEADAEGGVRRAIWHLRVVFSSLICVYIYIYIYICTHIVITHVRVLVVSYVTHNVTSI